MKTDKHVESVIKQYRERSELGIKKYNTTLERTDLNFLDWLQHLQEEMLDASLYIEVLKSKIKDMESELLKDLGRELRENT